jgi:D-alanyl-D-alanine carboxypeptidase/D-alanyl-D-alanine-endopeptidase (penicillin-binding protein 4)
MTNSGGDLAREHRLMPSAARATILFGLLAATSLARADLRSEVDLALRAAPLKGARVAVSVRDADTGATLVSVNADEPFIPASNLKILTSGAALHVLGPKFAFRTRLVRDADRLIVIGDGDPAFGDPELLKLMTFDAGSESSVDGFLGVWVRRVVDAGVTAIDEVIVDDRVFDREFVHPSWPADQLNNWYCAQVAGLNFHLNVLHFFPQPIPGHRPVIAGFLPAAPWLQPENHATSRTGPQEKNSLWIARRLGTNELTVKGNVRFAYREPVAVTIHDAPEFFARLLADRLTTLGVSVGRPRCIGAGEPEFAAASMAPDITTPIATVVTRCNRDSQNLYAEALTKRMGYELTDEPGSWSNGTAIVRHVLHERLSDAALASSVILADGSGLSRENRVTAETLTAWLNTFHDDQRIGRMFIDSLPVGGESGTLRERFRRADLAGAVVHGKSGYINGVWTLSGYVTMPDGRRRSFSILVNGDADSGAGPHAKQLHERIVTAIARDMASVTAQMGSD